MANNRIITRQDFLNYEKVRKSGKYDMLFSAAREATGLTEDQYYAIRTHYTQLAEMVKKENKDILLSRV